MVPWINGGGTLDFSSISAGGIHLYLVIPSPLCTGPTLWILKNEEEFKQREDIPG